MCRLWCISQMETSQWDLCPHSAFFWCRQKWKWQRFYPRNSIVIWLFWAIDAEHWTLIYPAKNALKKVSAEVSQMGRKRKLINLWYTQFDISYRPRSKQTNWVLFYLICFAVINSPAKGIIPSRKNRLKKKSIRYITQCRRLARLPWSISVIMGLVISFSGLSGNADLFLCALWFSFFNQVQKQRQEDRHSGPLILWDSICFRGPQ